MSAYQKILLSCKKPSNSYKSYSIFSKSPPLLENNSNNNSAAVKEEKTEEFTARLEKMILLQGEQIKKLEEMIMMPHQNKQIEKLNETIKETAEAKNQHDNAFVK